ncbi:flagellar FliL protein [Rhodovulum imhoffii]|uniref:Flagellar protein FliL n=1 Tax=Rhodovulum imhoffii TaxID=365340 RepID=A0A2T5BRV2_9RHOB|nr:flagellar basal body-associated FliL family protein [Rhodovulum imhoffii]MBK5934069.1 flagellar basal body protein FliL [Rhodovulum imhoffii]PTN01954.1 flagellar FliL protein [Rhodovulum imhoffii]
MADTPIKNPRQDMRLPLLAGLLLALVLGTGGFFVTFRDLLGAARQEMAYGPGSGTQARSQMAFVPLDTVVVTLGPLSEPRHLRFTAHLQTAPEYREEVSFLIPRILDVLNGYLRAVDLEVLEDRAALLRLRAQMLRRIQMITGEGRVQDLLVTEFIIN